MPDFRASNAIPGERGTFRPPMLTPIEASRVSQLYEMMDEANERGWEQASVVNLAPWTQNPSSVLLKGLRISAVPLAQEAWDASLKLKLKSGLEVPYVQHVIANPEFTVLEQVTGTPGNYQGAIKNKTWWPYDLAKDVVVGNNSMQHRGGVLCYKGSHSPFKGQKQTCLKETARPDRPGKSEGCGCSNCVQELLEEAHQRNIRYCEMMFTEAEQAFASRNEKLIRQIRDYHRWATRYLRRTGVLEKEPAWLNEILTIQDKAPVFCQACGAETRRKAVKCQECGFIIEPFRAFQLGIFDLDTPGAVSTLRRCSKDQLKELGLYPEVKPLDEYLREKDRIAAKQAKKEAVAN